MKTYKVVCNYCHGKGKLTLIDPDFLADTRIRSGLSLRGLGSLLGFSAQYLSDIEKGRRLANLSLASRWIESCRKNGREK